MKPSFVLCVILILFAGCKSQLTDSTEPTPFQQWKLSNIHNYKIEQARYCFCVDAGIAEITILADTVASAMWLHDSTTIPYESAKRFLTIDSLFGIINTPHADSLRYTYNKHYGFPDTLDINPQQHTVDGGVLFITSNLRIIK